MKKFLLFVSLLAVLMLVACNSDEEKGTVAVNSEEKLDKLVMAYLPIEGAEGVEQSSEAFHSGLSEAVGVPVEAYNVTSYSAAIEAMKNGHADMILMPPFAYLLGQQRAGVEALAKIGGQEVRGAIIVKGDSDIQTLEDLKGKTFGYIEATSSSGYMLPKTHLMKELNLTLEEIDKNFFKETKFVGSIDSAVIGVINGQYDAASVSSPILPAMVERGVIKESDFRIISETDPSPGIPFTVRGEIDEETKKKIQEFIISYDDPAFLENTLGIKNGRLEEVDETDYDVFKEMVELLEIDIETMVK